jgi:hypothetical protein
MPRRRRAVIREVAPDPVYNSTLVEKFVNSMMWAGKKNTAQGIFYEAMDKLRERTSDDPLKAFKKAVENTKPLLEVKTRRVGGANYQVRQRAVAPGEGHGREAGERIERRLQHARRRDQEEGRRAPHGGGQQGFRALPVVRKKLPAVLLWQD